MADILGTFKNLKFLLKFINLILVLICIIIWSIGRKRGEGRYHTTYHSGHTYLYPNDDNGMNGFSQSALYAHTVPAYVVILFVLVIAFFLDEEPEKWTSRLVLIPGAILFFVTSIIAFVNYFDQKSYPNSTPKDLRFYSFGFKSFLTAILCMVVCVIKIVDILKTENVF